MELEQGEGGNDRVNLMTLHAAKGLEFETVFLPGWEEGLFPSQRTMDEKGTAGLEEERRLAYVGLTRAKERARISFAANRRIHGSWQSGVPSRFVGELPQEHVEMIADEGMYGGYGGFRDNTGANFGSTYDSPGWRRAQAARGSANPFGGGAAGGFSEGSARKYGGGQGRMRGRVIDAEAKVVSTGDAGGKYKAGERVFHQKFGYGRITSVDGNKLEVEFDKAGTKRVIDGFVQRA
jgi:DNA helicase-2/ATP-dependent DNA helicase PcrA